ncbi:MAG: Gfo/Idh/MocA family oxidoreductase [Planctomycetes bacterium]|nr:Gfo/Idh/MocA family oxidoreductase [Planctomycetota bacterium]
MSHTTTGKDKGMFSRRDFMKATAAGAAALVAGTPSVHAAGSDRIRVGLIGCGGRGTGAARDCLAAAPNVELHAMGDAFQDRLDGSFRSLRDGKEPLGEKFNVTPERCFVGFDAYKKVLESGVDLALLGTPPHFRPEHLRAAVEAGKHVFMEKPVAVDPVGVRSVIASAELAAQKKLAIVAGTQRRHTFSYVETIKRIRDGAIGELLSGQCYWLMGGLWSRKPEPKWSQMEVQMRNWLYYTWLSGDHIVEQHVHNLDVVMWAFGGPPVKCMGVGGRQSRVDPIYGNIFDHFAVEYEWPNGARVSSMCRQAEGASGRNGERLIGTKGVAVPSGSITGENAWKYDGPNVNGQRQEHVDLIKSIRDGNPLNEGRQIAESTLIAIIGRMSCYTGSELKYDWALKASKLDLTPPKYEFGDLPVEPVAVPGKTPLV